VPGYDESSSYDELHPAWLLLAITGMRRGELLALRWSDIDLAAGTVSVRRAAILIKNAGESERIEMGPPKSGRSRVVDIDLQTIAVVRSHRAAPASLSLSFRRPDAYVFGDVAGGVRHPERFSRTFQSRVRTAQRALGDEVLPSLRLHDLRHTAATLMRATVNTRKS
jgi:integrase